MEKNPRFDKRPGARRRSVSDLHYWVSVGLVWRVVAGNSPCGSPVRIPAWPNSSGEDCPALLLAWAAAT